MEYASSMEAFEAMRLHIEQMKQDALLKTAKAMQGRVSELSSGKLVPDIREAGEGTVILSIPADPRTKEGQLVLAVEKQTGAFAKTAADMNNLVTKALSKTAEGIHFANL